MDEHHLDDEQRSELMLLGRPANRVISVLVWGGAAAGIFLPILTRLIVPFWSCDAAYLPRFPAKWLGVVPLGTLLLSVGAGGVATLLALGVFIANFRSHHRWKSLLNLLATPVLSVVVYMLSWIALFWIGTVPDVEDRLVVNGGEYVLATCMGFEGESCDVVLYQCNGKRRQCHVLARSVCDFGGQGPDAIRYENGMIIADGYFWGKGPLVHPLDDED